MRHALVQIINLYQRSLSPDHGWWRHQHRLGYCRFYPTCSEYAKQAILQHGVRRGLWLGAMRVGRCHPWASGGLDPVPE